MMVYFTNGVNRAVAAALAGLALLAAGCTGSRHIGGNKEYGMGTPANAGELVYTVVDSEWRESLDTPDGQRLPQNRFLLLNVTVMNRGGGDANIPLLALISADGKDYSEQAKGDGVPQWLGLLRSVGPSQTQNGRILFDVPQAGYKLRISSGGDAEAEITALIDVPLRLEPPPIQGVNPMAAPPPK